jgi:hypothetical protein
VAGNSVGDCVDVLTGVEDDRRKIRHSTLEKKLSFGQKGAHFRRAFRSEEKKMLSSLRCTPSPCRQPYTHRSVHLLNWISFFVSHMFLFLEGRISKLKKPSYAFMEFSEVLGSKSLKKFVDLCNSYDDKSGMGLASDLPLVRDALVFGNLNLLFPDK